MPIEIISDVRLDVLAEGLDTWHDLSDEKHFWFKWRFSEFKSFLARKQVNLQARNGLDVGCGSGLLMRQLRREYPGLNVEGVDLDLQALKRGLDQDVNMYFYDIMERRERFIAKYGFVLLFDVLEHISDPVSFLKAAREHLVPGGLLIVNVPAGPGLYSAYDQAAGHVKRYAISQLHDELAMAGFHEISSAYWGASLVPVLKVRKFLLGLQRRSPAQIIEAGFSASPLVNFLFGGLRMAEQRLFLDPRTGTSVMAIAQNGRAA